MLKLENKVESERKKQRCIKVDFSLNIFVPLTSRVTCPLTSWQSTFREGKI
jgi:hypothetical protein